MATALVLALLALPALALDAPAAALDCASHLHNMYVGARSFNLTADYNKHYIPTKNATVSVSVSINRISSVDENKEEISLDVFLQVQWVDPRVSPAAGQEFAEVPWEQRHILWIPDLYIRQLREMKMQSVFEEMSSMRVYANGTMRVSIGATIIIKCDMDFVLYPLDVQMCAVDFSSYKYTSQDLTFMWKKDSPVNYSSNRFRLPRYVVSFTTEREKRFIHYGEGNHSAARLLIRLSREIRSYLLETYLPSSLFVIISWGSFCVIPEIVPGRMVLLVTTLLALVTMFDTVRNTSPDALELKSIEVWLISCTIFVFLALMEYFVVLFGIRYDKHWRRRNRPTITTAALAPTAAIIANHAQRGGGEAGEVGSGCGRNGSRAAVPGVFAQTRIVPTEDDSLKQQLAAQTGREIQRASPIIERTMSENDDLSSDRSRLFIAVERVVLFCGSQRGTMDRFAIMIFPMSFSIFAMIYWTTYLNAANKQMRQ